MDDSLLLKWCFEELKEKAQILCSALFIIVLSRKLESTAFPVVNRCVHFAIKFVLSTFSEKKFFFVA